jgi:hypothetical protein
MGAQLALLCAVLLAASSLSSPASADEGSGDRAAEPEGGAGVSPIELVPRIELRQSFVRLPHGVSASDTTAEIDSQFLRRLLLRYQMPRRILTTPAGQITGASDIQLLGLGIIASDATCLLATIAGAVLNTASQPQLGAGKQQLFFGGGGAIKPRPWWLAYATVQEQFSIGGDRARPNINQLAVRLGNVLFGRQYNWLKVDLDTTVDFPGGAVGRFFGTFEAGSLVIGRVGLFVRGGLQLLGPRELDYTVTGGARYLFRLETAKPQPTKS